MNKKLLDSWFNISFSIAIAFGVVSLVTKSVNYYYEIMVLELLVKIFAGCSMIFLISSFIIFGYISYLDKASKKEE